MPNPLIPVEVVSLTVPSCFLKLILLVRPQAVFLYVVGCEICGNLWYSILSLSGGSCSWELNSRICRQRKSPSGCQVWHTQRDNGLITASGLMGLRRTECTQYTLIVYHHWVWGEVSDGFRSEKLPWWRISITQEQVTENHHWWLEQEVFLHMLIGNRKHIDYFQWRFSIHFMSDGKPSTSPTEKGNPNSLLHSLLVKCTVHAAWYAIATN